MKEYCYIYKNTDRNRFMIYYVRCQGADCHEFISDHEALEYLDSQGWQLIATLQAGGRVHYLERSLE